MATKKLEVIVPTVPNFIRLKGFDGSGNAAIPIYEFTESELREIGKEWTESLVKTAIEKLKSKKKNG